MTIIPVVGRNNIDRKRSIRQFLNLSNLIAHTFYRHGVPLHRVWIHKASF